MATRPQRSAARLPRRGLSRFKWLITKLPKFGITPVHIDQKYVVLIKAGLDTIEVSIICDTEAIGGLGVIVVRHYIESISSHINTESAKVLRTLLGKTHSMFFVGFSIDEDDDVCLGGEILLADATPAAVAHLVKATGAFACNTRILLRKLPKPASGLPNDSTP
jgi:hypothetical protein